MPMVFIQNPQRLKDELGFSGIGPEDRPKPGDLPTAGEVFAVMSRVAADKATTTITRGTHPVRRPRKSKRIRPARPAD
jgi:hypothetical protein